MNRCVAFQIALLVVAHPLGAQGRPAWALRIDNDYFNVWQPSSRRPDREYTHGIDFVTVTPVRAGRWHRRLGLDRACPEQAECHGLVLSLTQQIYTPADDVAIPGPGERPYAGWLAAGVGVSRQTARGAEVVRLVVGVTGPPSLAAATQTGAHRLFGYGGRSGWKGQIPAEPGVLVEFEGTRELARAGNRAGFRLAGLARGRIGTVAGGATVGLRAATGLRPSASFGLLPALRLGSAAAQLWAGANAELVLRNEFLQGPLFRRGPGVPIRHLVGELEGGVNLRLGAVDLSWRVVRRGREYPTQLTGHTYSSIGLALVR